MCSLIFLCALCIGAAVEALQTITHSDHLDVMHQPVYISILAVIDFLVWCLVYRCIGGYTFHQRTAFEAKWNKENPHFPCLNVQRTAEDAPMDSTRGEYKDGNSKSPDANLFKQANSSKNKSFFDDPRNEALNISRDLTPSLILIITCFLVYILNHHNYPNAAKYADPIMALCMIAFLIISSIPMCKKATHILLQGLPEELDNVEGLCQGLKKAFSDTIIGLHEVHVWCLVPNKIYATLHIIFKNEDSYLSTTSVIQAFLLKFGINNATIQPEFLEMEKQTARRKKSLSYSNSENIILENSIQEDKDQKETNIEFTATDILLYNTCCRLPCRHECCLKKRCCMSKKI